MKIEKEKMLSGELYHASDAELSKERLNALRLSKVLNNLPAEAREERLKVLKELMPNAGQELSVQPPFYCDYGYNIYAGEQVCFNFNCIVLDVMPVKIGSRTMFGPNVQLYTASHPINNKERATGAEFAKPIIIGEDVWVGGSAVICPGVSIGDRTVIGAGSVVTKDIPSDVLAAGNPCKLIRKLEIE